MVRGEDQGEVVPIEPLETAELLSNAKEVMIIPGYGMAVAQAQHGVADLVQRLRDEAIAFSNVPQSDACPGKYMRFLQDHGIIQGAFRETRYDIETFQLVEPNDS